MITREQLNLYISLNKELNSIIFDIFEDYQTVMFQGELYVEDFDFEDGQIWIKASDRWSETHSYYIPLETLFRDREYRLDLFVKMREKKAKEIQDAERQKKEGELKRLEERAKILRGELNNL